MIVATYDKDNVLTSKTNNFVTRIVLFHSLKDFLRMAQPYIRKKYLGHRSQANNGEHRTQSGIGERDIIQHKEEGEHYSRFDASSSLNTLRGEIYKKCTNIKFKEVGIINMYLIKESSQSDKSKYFCFYKSHDYNTNIVSR